VDKNVFALRVHNKPETLLRIKPLDGAYWHGPSSRKKILRTARCETSQTSDLPDT
jgi:hypothetical protein